jgi:hypothetical protein
VFSSQPAEDFRASAACSTIFISEFGGKKESSLPCLLLIGKSQLITKAAPGWTRGLILPVLVVGAIVAAL